MQSDDDILRRILTGFYFLCIILQLDYMTLRRNVSDRRVFHDSGRDVHAEPGAAKPQRWCGCTEGALGGKDSSRHIESVYQRCVPDVSEIFQITDTNIKVGTKQR